MERVIDSHNGRYVILAIGVIIVFGMALNYNFTYDFDNVNLSITKYKQLK